MDLHTIRCSEYAKVHACYHEAFPLNERLPFLMLLARFHSGYADFLTLTDQKELLGFTYVCRNEKLCYMCYLAVEKNHRDEGLGGKIVEMLRCRYAGRPILIALEPQDPQAKNAHQRSKRHAFYEKNGFHDIPFDIEEGGIRFAAMSTGEVQAGDYNRLMHDFLGWFGRLYLKMEMRLKA